MNAKEKATNMINACRTVGEWEGGQQKARLDFGESCSTEMARLRACAAVMRVLTGLRELSYSKDLTPNMVQACIDGFYDKAEIEEDVEPMGQIIYKRKAAA